MASNSLSKPTSKHVKVYVRTRPSSNFAHDIIQFDSDQKSIHIHSPKNNGDGYINNQLEDWDFTFDQILHNVSQEHVYEECAAPIVHSLLEGYNGTILAYGQTGAGKTFTMTGATDNYKHRGLIPQTISHVFREISEKPQFSYVVRISYLEVYNEQMIDLLFAEDASSTSSYSGSSDDPNSSFFGPLTVVDEKSGSTRVKGLNIKTATSEEEALSYLFEGDTNRTIAEHTLNRNSSRSHCIFTIYLEARSKVESTEKIIHSKLNLVDLAGSERVSKTETTGQSMREAMYINKSLTYLEQVVLALADKKREHIPFRQTKMTHVLKDALGGNNNTLLIANIWGEKQHIEETISTLRFATRMRCVSTTPVINVQYDTIALIKKYEREIKELKLELSMHDTLSNRSYIQYEPYTENQKAELEKTIKSYLDSDSDDFEILSLRHMKEIMIYFKRHMKSTEATIQAEAAQSLKKKESVTELAPRKDQTSPEHTDKATEKEEARVGELESTGFAIGVAPATSKPPAKSKDKETAKEKPEKGSKSKKDGPKTSVTTPASINTTSGPAKHDDVLDSPSPTSAVLPGLEEVPVEVIVQEVVAVQSTIIAPKPRNGPPPSRADEFEVFKKDRGVDLNKAMGEKKLVLHEKKRIARDLAEGMNKCRSQIETIKDKLAQKTRFHEFTDATSGSGEIIIDEEEYTLLNALKNARQEYKDALNKLNVTRSEIDINTRAVDQARQKLMTDFEQFYEATYGTPKHDQDRHPGQVEDKMDVAEKFDKMQTERMAQQDPDAIPYYNARKNNWRKFQNILKKSTAGPAVLQKTAPVVRPPTIKS